MQAEKEMHERAVQTESVGLEPWRHQNFFIRNKVDL